MKLGGYVVLVVDDDPDGTYHFSVQRMIKRLVPEGTGVTYLPATTVEMAEEMIQAAVQIDLALFDGSMSSAGTLDTLPLVEKVRKKFPQAVLVASSRTLGYQLRLKAEGCHRVLEKDNVQDELPILISEIQVGTVLQPVMA